MSGITLDDIASEGEKKSVAGTDYMEEMSFPEEEQQNNRVMELASRAMSAETGIGTIDDYIQHPLNFNSSKGLARVIRGLTGMFGNLNLAIIDVALGLLEVSKERKGANAYVSNGGILRP